MESLADFCNKSLIDKIVLYLIRKTHKDSSSVIKINSENLAVNGELYFLNSLNAWRSYVASDKDCANILQYAHGATKDTDADVAKEVFDQLISKSSTWSIKIQRCVLQKERVCLFLNRMDIIPNVIRMAFESGAAFGRMTTCDKGFSLEYQPDAQSDLTTWRLHLTRNVAAKILNLHGYRCISNEDCIGKYVFTTKSEGAIDQGYKKYVCGVVKNARTNAKETCLMRDEYIKRRMDQLAKLNQQKLLENDEDNLKKDLFLRDIANIIVIFELMTAKPSRSIVIGNDNSESDSSVTNIRRASFVMYNTARIMTILAKYNEKVSRGDYPSLPNINDIDFSQLHEEDEWDLVYNFIFGYPQMLKDCLRLEPSFQIYPQVICLFLSRLCQKFSVFYRRFKILTEGGDHLIPKMLARLYMLHALKVILENALNILDIKPVSRM